MCLPVSQNRIGHWHWQVRETELVGRPEALRARFLVYEAYGQNLKEFRLSATWKDVNLLPYDIALPLISGIVHNAAMLLLYGVVHLDMKLDNILLDNDTHIVLCDLGEAKVRIWPGVPFSAMIPMDDWRSCVFTQCQRVDLRTHTALLNPAFQSPGGNIAHLAPEVLNSFNSGRRRVESDPVCIPYGKQVQRQACSQAAYVPSAFMSSDLRL